MDYETPEVFVIGPAGELTLGGDGNDCDSDCLLKCREDLQQL